VLYVVSELCVCVCVCARTNYYVFPFPHPSTPAAILLGAISIDVILQQVGMKGQQVKYGK